MQLIRAMVLGALVLVPTVVAGPSRVGQKL